MNYHKNDLVQSCPRLESGLRFGPEGLSACQLGAFAAPVFWSAQQAAQLKMTKEMIISKRKALFDQLNDHTSDITCKRCLMVQTKRFADVDFTQLGQIDLASSTICNLRCKFCLFAMNNISGKAPYDDLAILSLFSQEDVQWDAVVDFNGGEPTLLPDLEEYLAFFRSRRIRIRFMTNGVRFHPAVYAGLQDGSIQWVITSLDAGTPSTYARIKKRDHYLTVLENLTKYASAGSRGGGKLGIKYIFCQDNCGIDDIAGFSYAVLAIRPQQVLLTFDFTVINGDALAFGDYDYSRDIDAYSQMYRLLTKHGLTPVHYAQGHLAKVCHKGQMLLESVRQEIERAKARKMEPGLLLDDFRTRKSPKKTVHTERFMMNPLRIFNNGDQGRRWCLADKKILIAPACTQSRSLLSDPEIQNSLLLGFVDRDRMIQGKTIDGWPIHSYADIASLGPEVVLVAAPEHHQDDVVQQVAAHAPAGTRITVLGSLVDRPSATGPGEKNANLTLLHQDMSLKQTISSP